MSESYNKTVKDKPNGKDMSSSISDLAKSVLEKYTPTDINKSIVSSTLSPKTKAANYDEDMDYNGDGKVTIDERIRYYTEKYSKMDDDKETDDKKIEKTTTDVKKASSMTSFLSNAIDNMSNQQKATFARAVNTYSANFTLISNLSFTI